jgi:hypothetical protein
VRPPDTTPTQHNPPPSLHDRVPVSAMMQQALPLEGKLDVEEVRRRMERGEPPESGAWCEPWPWERWRWEYIQTACGHAAPFLQAHGYHLFSISRPYACGLFSVRRG